MSSRIRSRLSAFVATMAMVAGILPVATTPALAQVDPEAAVFINEVHYDNDGTDAGEFIEVAGPAGTDLTGWSLVLYNGANGESYSTTPLTGSLGDQDDGFGTVSISYPVNGIQNGSPDGIALVAPGDAVSQFISYEGSFSAVDGPATGITSTDIGVDEPGSTPAGESLQLTGTGDTYGEFTWTGAAASTAGAINTGQDFTTEDPDPDPDPDTTTVFINELHYDNAGADADEGFEVVGPAGTVLDGWSVEFYNGSNGTVYDTTDLSGTIDDEGNGFGALSYLVEGIQNGSPDALALIDSANEVVQFISYEGTLVAVGGAADGMSSTDIGVSESSSAPLGTSMQLNGPGTTYEELTWQTGVDATLGCINLGQPDLGTGDCDGPDPDPDPQMTLISAIQGSGAASAMVGTDVIVEGVVVADFEGPSPNLRGFYVQEEDADQDGDPATSEALFVFNFDNNSVVVGDVVRVTGTVSEFQDQTQLDFPDSIEVIDSGASVSPAVVDLPVPTSEHLERYEGMLVTIPETLYVTEFFQLGRFGQVVVSSGDRLQQPTAVAEPGGPANAIQAANDLNRLILDDRTNDQNPDPIVFGRNGDPLTASNTLRGGDTLTGATGVLTYTWAGNSASGNAYRLRPAAEGAFDFQAANPRPSSSPSVGGSVQVASFNVLNYFLTLDDGPPACGPTQSEDCRGAETAEELQRQRTKLMAALTEIDADVVGLIEMENSPDVSPEADIAAGLNDELGAGTYDYIDAGLVGDDAIRVGLIYRPAAVTPLGDHTILDYGDGRNRASLAQTFVDNASGEVFSVVVNHFKSKGCGDATGADADQGDGQGCWNATRLAAANALSAWIATDPTGIDDDDWLIVGDLNSYDHEDPITALKSGGFVDLALEFTGEEAYSYVFDGQWGYLDYALASSSLLGQVTGAAEYHINADEPSVLDYNTNFKSAGQIDSLFAPDEFRTSDHDPILVGLDLDGDVVSKLRARPSLLIGLIPNHRTVKVTSPGADVSILDVVSSEADSGLGPHDSPNDIVIVDDTRVKLRVESYSWLGRTYTIQALVTDDGQSVVDTTDVWAYNLLTILSGGGGFGLW